VTVTASAVDWLLESEEPGIVFQAKRDLLDEAEPAEAVHVLEGPKVRALRSTSTRSGPGLTGGSSRSSSWASPPASLAASPRPGRSSSG
jgi:hypothetical protein